MSDWSTDGWSADLEEGDGDDRPLRASALFQDCLLVGFPSHGDATDPRPSERVVRCLAWLQRAARGGSLDSPIIFRFSTFLSWPRGTVPRHPGRAARQNGARCP